MWSTAFVLLWFVTATVGAMLPTKDSHWTLAYWLIGAGLPLLGWFVWENGVWLGLLVLAGAMSVLRWPVRFLIRWILRKIGIKREIV